MNSRSLAFRIIQEETDVPDVPEVPEEETLLPPEEDTTHHLSQSILVMLAIVAINAIVLGYLRKARSKYPVVARYVQDAPVTTLIGILAGLILHLTGLNHLLAIIGDGYLNFFMIILLPPILFESTINMHKKSFFRNIGTILMYAVFGTLIASCFTAFGVYLIGLTDYIREFEFTFGESFAFGSLISSIDPVSVLAIFKEMSADKTLYSLVFGESIMNDAIAIVLYNTIVEIGQDGDAQPNIHPLLHFIFLLMGSIFIGFIIGIVSGMILKSYFGRSDNANTANTETTLMIVIPWVAYLIGEGFDMSGVVTILFCGISMTKYALPYLSDPGKQLTQSLYSTLSTTAEQLVFIFIGIGFFSFEHHWNRLRWTILLLAFIVIIFARYINITIISFIANLFRKQNKITKNHQRAMIYSGFRGAMAFALATNAINVYKSDGAGSMMLTLTLVYATLTIFVQGTLLVPVMEHFGVVGKSDAESSVFDDEDPLQGTSWVQVKRAFHKIESLFSRLFMKWSRDDGEKLTEEDIYQKKSRQGCSAKLDKELGIFDKKETERINVRRIRSDSDATVCYSLKNVSSQANL